MINKIKLVVAAVLLAFIATLLGLYFLERGKNRSLRTEQARLQEKLRLSELRKKISETPAQEIKTLHRAKDAKDSGLNAGSKLSDPELCGPCFQNFEYQVEVKDEAGRWIFSDNNIFDKRPGHLTLTDKFWLEIEQEKTMKNASTALDVRAPLGATSPQRLKNRILVGAELDRYKIEYAYSPLGYRVQKFELGLTLYSSLSMSYASAPLEARAGIGVEVRF